MISRLHRVKARLYRIKAKENHAEAGNIYRAENYIV